MSSRGSVLRPQAIVRFEYGQGDALGGQQLDATASPGGAAVGDKSQLRSVSDLVANMCRRI